MRHSYIYIQYAQNKKIKPLITMTENEYEILDDIHRKK